MAKPIKYPRKLRATLERVAAGAAGRREYESVRREIEEELGEDFDPLHVFWNDFLPRKSLAFMATRTDEVLRRIEVVNYFEAPREHFEDPTLYCTAPAPWAETDVAGDTPG